MRWRHPGNTKFNKQNISAERAAASCFRQGWCTRSEERLSSRSMGTCQQDFMSLYPTLFNKDVDSGELWKQELLTGLFYDLVRMTFWTNFSPCADPLPTREADVYKAALICISCPKGEIVRTGSGHRTVLTLLILLTSSIAFILQWVTRWVKVHQSPVTLSSHSKVINIDFLNVQF